ncbi:MAG: mannosylglycerate hydrolase [Eubacteriaceae bacterium]
MGNKVHVVPHMHWDREWYFTAEESRILLVNNMEEIMEMLETNQDYPYYVLDGQTAVLEDYFQVKPENKERFTRLVQAGKLIIGPWYTQTDSMVVGGESIVRNLLYGMKDCREYGEPMMIGYLPDSFGQSEKLPQILNGFGIERGIFWRGSSERHGTNKQSFFWKSNSEGSVLVQLMPLGYAIGKYLPVEIEPLKKRMEKYIPVLDRGAVTEHILLPNGHDQMPIQKNIFEVMNVLKEIYPERDFFLSRYEKIFDQLEKVPQDTIYGELIDGKYMRVHRSIFSSRSDLKSSNTRIENKITNQLEPLASIAYKLGFSYEEGLIEGIWKELLKNHAHDSIGCCCSDKVHKAIENRFFLVEEKVDELIRFYKRKIVDAMKKDITLDKLTVFNLLPYKRCEMVQGQIITKMKNFNLVDDEGREIAFDILKTEVVDPGLIDRQIVHYGDYDPFVKYTLCFQDEILSMGYKTYFIKEKEGIVPVALATENKDILENEYYFIKVQKNGALEIQDKKTGILYSDVLLLEDGSDDGDGYDYSPLEDDYLVYSDNAIPKVRVKSYEKIDFLEISYTLAIPKNLESRKKRVLDSSMDIQFNVELERYSPIIKIQMTVDNKAEDHRVRVLIPNKLSGKFSVSDNQFGEIKRPVIDPAMAIWKDENWDERPDAIYPMLSYVGLETKEGLSVLTNSVREFEVIGEKSDTLAITIFRGTGYLGKDGLLRRPGRPSGIKMPTPDSQMLGVHTYDFAIIRSTKNLGKYAKEYTTPMVTYNKMPYNGMKLNDVEFNTPYHYSLLTEGNEKMILSTVKKAEGENGLIIRGYNGTTKDIQVDFQFNDELELKEVKLDETKKISVENPREITMKPGVAKSYFLPVIRNLMND